jgi:hypothetical protein
MHVSDIRVAITDAECELQGRVASDRDPDDDDWFEPFTLWYRFPSWCAPYLSPDNGDPFLAALLFPAMHLGEPLAITAPVSPRLLAAVGDIAAIYAHFDKQAVPVAVAASARADALPTPRSAPGAGLFFSLGVDSFYSLLKNRRDHPHDRQTITHLIYVHGFEIGHPRWDSAFPPRVLDNLHRVGAALGATIVPVVTNVQRVCAPLAPWTIGHGGGLVSVALALGSLLGRVHIAATTTYDRLYSWGTHPVLDPRWSTERLTVIHDGCELNTIDKTAVVAGSPLALAALRVCPGYGPEYNCGRCLKCLRTMLDLMMAGALDRCQTLPHEIALDAAALHDALRPGNSPQHIADFRRRLDMLESSGGPPALRAALAAHLARLVDSDTQRPPRRSLIWRWQQRISGID